MVMDFTWYVKIVGPVQYAFLYLCTDISIIIYTDMGNYRYIYINGYYIYYFSIISQTQ